MDELDLQAMLREEEMIREREYWENYLADYYGKDDLPEEDAVDIDSPIWNTYEDEEGSEWYELNL